MNVELLKWFMLGRQRGPACGTPIFLKVKLNDKMMEI